LLAGAVFAADADGCVDIPVQHPDALLVLLLVGPRDCVQRP